MIAITDHPTSRKVQSIGQNFHNSVDMWLVFNLMKITVYSGILYIFKFLKITPFKYVPKEILVICS